MQPDPGYAHSTYGKIYMMPVDPQQFRPKAFAYWEAGNSATFRDAWTSAIQGGTDWVQLVTWSDFSESGEVEPFTDATLSPSIGTGFYDLNAYYASWFLTGQQPTITHDVLYYFYRRESTSAATPSQSEPENILASSPENDIELLAFLTAPGTLEITIGGQTYTQSAPAGLSSFKVPLQPGVPQFALVRSGSTVVTLTGGVQIYGEGGITSGPLAGAQDLTYWSGSASKSGVCSISTQQ
jgi:Glycosyl hydrolase family 71